MAKPSNSAVYIYAHNKDVFISEIEKDSVIMNASKGENQPGRMDEEIWSKIGQFAATLTKIASEAVNQCWPDEETIRSKIGPLAATLAKNAALESLKLVPGIYAHV